MKMNLPYRTLSLFACCCLMLVHADTTCDEETESVLQIDFAIAQDFTDFTWSLQLTSDRETKDGELFYQEYKELDQVPTTATQCIPKNECIVLQVSELPSDQYTIQVDNEVITAGPTLPHVNSTMTTTEIGSSCIPTCLDGQALFHVAAFTSESYLDWRLEDATNGGDVMLDGCSPRSGKDCSWSQWSLYHARRCLPVDGCYRVIVGDMTWGTILMDMAGLPQFDITFNDQTVANLEGFRFEAIEFGNQCTTTCQEDNESLLEMFFFRTAMYDTYPNVSWSFSDGETTLLEGISTWNEPSLKYVRDCVPLNACLTFNASVPETYEVEEGDGEFMALYHESNPYRLSMDGIIYAEGYCSFGSFDNDLEEFSEAAFVGECDATDFLCDTESHSLLDLQLETGKDAHGSIDWRVDYANNDESTLLPIVEAWDMYDGFFPDVSYRTYLCLPRDKCLEFTFTTSEVENEEVIKYGLSYDDVVVEKRECGDSACLGDTLTYLGGDGCATRSPASGPVDNPEGGPEDGPTGSPESSPTASPKGNPETSPESGPTKSPESGPKKSPELGEPNDNLVDSEDAFTTGSIAGVVIGSMVAFVVGFVIIAWIRKKLYYDKEPITPGNEGFAASEVDAVLGDIE